jgi:hypothetical protein
MAFDGEDAGDKRRREEIDFFDELNRMATAAQFRSFAVVLMNGADVVVDPQSSFGIYKSMYIVDAADGSSVMFPRYNACAIRVLAD